MTNDSLYKMLEENNLTSEEIEKWKQLIEEMDEDDKREFSAILSEQEKEKNILATRQSNELVDLMHRWRIESEA